MHMYTHRRAHAHTKSTTNTPNTLLFITTHNHKNTEVYSIIRHTIPLLKQDTGIKKNALVKHKKQQTTKISQTTTDQH